MNYKPTCLERNHYNDIYIWRHIYIYMYSYYTVNILWLLSHSEHFQPRFGWALEINPRQVQAQRIGTVGWWFRNPGRTHQLILVVYLIIDRVLYIQNGEVGSLSHYL